jgi:MFS family permease
MNKSRVTIWLSKTNRFIFSVYVIIAAFGTYACMYAFRKPFSVAGFEGMEFYGFDYKTALVIAQVFGYMLSKFLGIKFISEMKPAKRGISILVLIGIAEASLVLFSIVPAPLNIIFLFINGLPLGMVWGLVFGYLEGRRLTEILGAGLSVSFIVSSGFVKSIGDIVISVWGFSEFQMPFITGALFIIPVLLFVWMLNQVPPPDKLDEELRTKRVPMNKEERRRFFLLFAAGIIILTVIYMFLTAFRDLRDNFAADIWAELGYTKTPLIFTYTELPVAVGVLVILGSVMWIKNNLKALIVNHYIVLSGILLTGFSTVCFEWKLISAPVWMVLTGLGLYMGYIPFNCILFDRLIAVHKTSSNSGYLIYIADSFGYLASVAVLLYKNFGQSGISWLSFTINSSYVLAVIGTILTLVSIFYFKRKSSLKILPGVVTGKA